MNRKTTKLKRRIILEALFCVFAGAFYKGFYDAYVGPRSSQTHNTHRK